MDIKWTLLWIIGLYLVAGKMASISEGNSDISDFEGFTEEDLVENISVVQVLPQIVQTLQFLLLEVVTFLT